MCYRRLKCPSKSQVSGGTRRLKNTHRWDQVSLQVSPQVSLQVSPQVSLQVSPQVALQGSPRCPPRWSARWPARCPPRWSRQVSPQVARQAPGRISACVGSARTDTRRQEAARPLPLAPPTPGSAPRRSGARTPEGGGGGGGDPGAREAGGRGGRLWLLRPRETQREEEMRAQPRGCAPAAILVPRGVGGADCGRPRGRLAKEIVKDPLGKDRGSDHSVHHQEV
ncbi:unnamed protein product [Nyctereutes procyonoides]|uniref:(raccoon dog) hypothetical protein n=1 Tax=Nyctereutes procyonoides TaxID=34880 RepID=A0A811Y257_NYCPR|nr:unnamed protein product [Nyctereutes procyonoides]